jgi:hypothetical protein
VLAWAAGDRSGCERLIVSLNGQRPSGPELTDAYVALRYWCVRAGHALGQKHHEADRWVAATAMWLGVPLVAHDAIFASVEGLNLLTKLDL